MEIRRLMSSPEPNGPVRVFLLPAALVALAAALRLLGLEKGYWLDEALTMRVVNAPTLWEAARAFATEQSPPLYFVTLLAWAAASASEAWLRLFSVVPAIGALALTGVLLERTRRGAGAFALLLMAAHPLLLRYAQEFRPYAWLLLWQAVALLAASRLQHEPRDRRWSALLAIALVGAGCTHFVGMLLIPALMMFLVIAAGALRPLVTRPVVLAFLVGAAVPATVLAAQSLRWPTEGWWAPPVSGTLLVAMAREMTAAESFRFVAEAVRLPAAGPVALGVVLGGLVLATADGRSRPSLAWFASALAFAGAVVGVSVLAKPILLPRTLLPVVPLVVGGLALQAASTRGRWTGMAGWIGASTFALIGALWWVGGGAWRPVEPWPQAAAFIDARWAPGDLVVVVPNYAGQAIEANSSRPDAIPIARVALREGRDAGTRLAAAIALAPRGAKLLLVLRVDLSSRARLDTLEGLLDAAGRAAHDGRTVALVVVTSHDVGFAPELHDEARRVVAEARARMGPLHVVRDEALLTIVLTQASVGR